MQSIFDFLLVFPSEKQINVTCTYYRISIAKVSASQVMQWYRIHLPMKDTQEMQVQSLDQENPLEKEMETLSSILAWKIPWVEEPGRL